MSEAVVLVPEGVIARAGVPWLCARLRDRLELQAGVVICDLGALGRPDAVTIDALARLQLTAGRGGSRVVLRRASQDLQRLLALTGLLDVLPLRASSPLQVRGQAEEGEQVRVEEDRDPRDPAG